MGTVEVKTQTKYLKFLSNAFSSFHSSMKRISLNKFFIMNLECSNLNVVANCFVLTNWGTRFDLGTF